MDSFVIIRRQKKEDGITLHDREIQDLKRLLEEGKNVFICGAAGVGKSYILNRVLDESNSIEIYDEVLTKKDIYLDTIKNSNVYAYIENYETDNMYKSIIDSVSEGGWVTKRPLVVTSQNVHVLPNFKMLFIPKRKPESIERLQPGHVRARLAAEECRGNILNFFSYLNFTDVKDIFKTSKEFIEELLCTPCTIDIEETVHEHGHIWDTVHENYLDSGTDHYDKIMDSLVSADTYDTELYKGDWDCMPYFVFTRHKNSETIYEKSNQTGKDTSRELLDKVWKPKNAVPKGSEYSSTFKYKNGTPRVYAFTRICFTWRRLQI